MPVPPLELLLPAILVGVAFLGYCYFDLYRVAETRFLPKWAWGVLCALSIPFGGIAYLLLGRGHTSHA
ncbi:PLDc N-terminal domain-containing protein [Nocardiopsis halotolerans]|uniref:PLDc N-terminal domain-containing protein n=1 Tax=Nocardiopsis halotolerans TaxID=124252 RepID=UPI000375657F|nr:PLDc N-terminal domain-containing protein [Nocardiopsis halotolerans]